MNFSNKFISAKLKVYYFHFLCCKFLICKGFALSGTRDFKITVPLSLSTLATPYIRSKSVFGCSPEFEELALRLVLDNNLRQLYNAADSRSLYDTLLRLINTNLNINTSNQGEPFWYCLIWFLWRFTLYISFRYIITSSW